MSNFSFIKRIVSLAVAATTILWSVGIAGLAPVATQAAQAGDLVKQAGSPAVYYVGSDGGRYTFPNASIYQSWYTDFNGVDTISAVELGDLRIFGNVTYRPGTYLVKIPSDPRVYAVEPGGVLRWITTSEIADALYGAGNWQGMIKVISEELLGTYSYGSDITTNTYPTGTVISNGGNNYYVDGNSKRMISSAGFSANNFQSKFVVAASDTLAGALGNGTAITGFESALWNPVGGSSSNPTPVGSATVSLANDTPAAGQIADAGNANFTKFMVSAGTSPVTLNSMTVTRYGLSANADLENVKILDANGVSLGNSATFNSNNEAKVTFNPAVTVPANGSSAFYIRAGVVDRTTGGKTIQLGIAEASDIGSSASIGGSFPVVGNAKTTVTLTIGTVSVASDGTVIDSTPDVGDTDVVVNKFKISAGSTEPVTIEQIAVERQGSAGSSDTRNIELYDVTHGVSLGTVSTWNAQGLAVFNNLNLLIDEGDNVRFEVRLDVVEGVGLTVNADLTDGSDVRVVAKGNDFGFYITPSVTGGWNGLGGNNQTINSGGLTISKSTATPATGNVTADDEQLLAVLDVRVEGEPVRVTSFGVGIDLVSGTAEGEVTNARLKNYATGAILGGPNTVSNTDSGTYEQTVTFTDTIEFPVGVTQVGIYVDISTDTSDGDQLAAGATTVSTGITARGIESNDTITASPAAEVKGNTQTINAGSLTATTLSQPAARNVVVGAQDFIWSTFELSAAGSGEDVQVTALTIENTVNENAGGDSGAQDIDNVEIWADLTAANSTRGDAYETLVSDTKQFTGTGDGDATLSFTLSQTVTIKKDQSVRMAVVADLGSGADASDTHTISLDTDAGDVTANGASTGSSISVTPTGAGQAMTVATAGVLTVSVDSSSPKAKLLLDDGQDGKTTLGIFRLAASNAENIGLDTFMVTDDGTGDDGVDTYYFQATTKTGTNIGAEKSVAGGATANAFWNSGEVVIPSNDYILMVVKGTTNPVDDTAVVNGDAVEVTVADPSGEAGGGATTTDDDGDITATGQASGSTIDPTTDAALDAATHYLVEAYPTFAFDQTTSTVLTPSDTFLAARLNITVIGDSDITFTGAGDDANVLKVQVSRSQSDDDDSTDETLTVYDSAGTLLDTIEVNDAATGTTEETIDFSSGTDTIAAGGSETWTFYYEASDLEADGDTLQIWLDDASGDLDFGINGKNFTNDLGPIILRSDVFGVTAVNPS